MATRTLTDAFVKAARCESPARILEIRDSEVRGLELRVLQSGVKSWRLHYTRRGDGKRRALGLGHYPRVSLKEARVRAKRLQAEIEDEEVRADPAAQLQARKAALTFREIVDEWIDRHALPNKRPRTLRGDRQMLERHVLPEIGAMKAAEITKRDVIRLLDIVASKPDARVKDIERPNRTMTHQPNRVFELVRSIFRWAVGRDLLKADPSAGLSPPIRKERARERELSPYEIWVLWSALDRATARRQHLRRASGEFPMRCATALAIKLALATAQRIGEVAGIAMSELDLNDSRPVWTVPSSRSKNGEPNRVPLSPLAVGVIKDAIQLAGESNWLFPGAKGTGPIDPYAPIKAIERARSMIAIPHFRVHDLRRTAATRMAEMGISPHTISLVLNHVSARRGTVTSKVYVQYSYDREKREALNHWSERLERIIVGNEENNGSREDFRARAFP
jgi:integrase